MLAPLEFGPKEWKKMSKAQTVLPKTLNLSQHLLGKCVEQVSSLRFRGTCKQHVYCVCLYCRLLELARDSLRLIESGATIGLSVLLRSALETFVDFVILVKCPDYWRTMHAQSLKQQLKMGRPDPDNPFLKNLQSSQGFRTQLSKIESDLEELKKNGHKPLEIWERYKKAEMSHEHSSVYVILCMETHVDLLNLQHRYLRRSATNPEIRVPNHANSDSVLGNLFILLDILLKSSEKVRGMLLIDISFKEEREILEGLVHQYNPKGLLVTH